MDCKTCKNYEPIDAPFDGVKTDKLIIGMLLKAFHRGQPFRGFFVVVEEPDFEKVRVINIFKEFKPRETEIYLVDHGCQPYENGRWNSANYLQEVT